MKPWTKKILTQKTFFFAVGLIFLIYCLASVWKGNVTNASIIFGMSFLCFIYANISNFKKFKGLGFEAELWEDKKKEVEELVERLQEIIAIYSSEILITAVKGNRYDGGGVWEHHWLLYNKIVEQHEKHFPKIVKQNSSIKLIMDRYFLFDILSYQYDYLKYILNNDYQYAINRENTIECILSEKNAFIEQAIGYFDKADLLDLVEKTNVANDVLIHLNKLIDDSEKKFNVSFAKSIDRKIITDLQYFSDSYGKPLKITDYFIELSGKRVRHGRNNALY